MENTIALIETKYRIEVETLTLRVEELALRLEKAEALVKHYEELFRLSQSRKFGPSGEQNIIAGQLNLFGGQEVSEAPEAGIEEVIIKRKKRKGKRYKDLADFPTEVYDYELPQDGRACPECGKDMHNIGHDCRRELKIIPAQVLVVEHRQHKYACRNCCGAADSSPIIRADGPMPLISGSIASASLVSHIMNNKYMLALPLYRQEKEFERMGINLSRQNMANWVVFCALNYLYIIYASMKGFLLQETVIHADETTVQVLREDGKSAQSKSYEFVYRTSGCSNRPIILYEYQPTREHKHPVNFLEGFSGYIHTDGWEGYRKVQGATIVGCWAHARRKFGDALKVLPPDRRKDSAAAVGVAYCDKLFELERQFSHIPPDSRLKRRLTESKPVAEAFFAWAEQFRGAIPKTKLVEAAEYLLGQRLYLENVYLDGRLELSNNRAERSVKPFVIGRKNWLFSNTVNGAVANSIIYSIVETALANGLKPLEYLKFLLETLPSAKFSDVDNLLPWSTQLPAVCRLRANQKEPYEDEKNKY